MGSAPVWMHPACERIAHTTPSVNVSANDVSERDAAWSILSSPGLTARPAMAALRAHAFSQAKPE
jgi:hypothetical protein